MQKLCYICKKEFSTDDDNKKHHKVRDHCLYTRKFRGAAHITFSVPISKELDNGKTIMYRLKFIDSFRFMSTSLSDLADNLSEI